MIEIPPIIMLTMIMINLGIVVGIVCMIVDSYCNAIRLQGKEKQVVKVIDDGVTEITKRFKK